MPSERAVSSKSPSVMRCTESLLECPGKSSTLHWSISSDNNAAEPGPAAGSQTLSKLLQLFLVDVLLQLDAGSKFRHSSRGNFDDTARLRITPVACLALRNREGPEAHQGHAVAFFQRRRDRIHHRVNRTPRSRFTDAVGGGDFFHQVSFVHSCS